MKSSVYLNTLTKTAIMKKKIIGSIVGGLILFIWQALSHTVLMLHADQEKYTANQDAILNFLGTQLQEEGDYVMPNFPPGTSMQDMQKQGEAFTGKPWARISFHKVYDMNMTMPLVRTFLVDFVLVLLLCWILFEFAKAGFGKIFLCSLIVGLIAFLNQAYTGYIWYHTAGIYADLTDAVVSWGLCGIWLGWWLRKK